MPLSKRQLLATLFCVGIVTGHADEVIKILGANISTGNKQSYDGGEGNRIFQGLKPDVAMIQEMNISTNTASDVRTWVDRNFGTNYSVFRETGKNIPNGIVSRFPILESGEWDDVTLTDREFVWARIDIPGDKKLLAVCVHLKASSGGTNSNQRSTQAANLKSYIQAKLTPGDYIAIAGDFNTQSRSEPCLTTFSSFMVTSAPYPADGNGQENTNENRNKPYDWVMADPGLASHATPLVIGANTFPNGIVFDSRVYTPLKDVAPVVLGDSGANGMQHMAVMRAFLIPVAAAPPSNKPPVLHKPAGGKAKVSLSRGNYPVPFALSLSADDADGDALNWSISTVAGHGTAGIVAPATGNSVAVSYEPAAGFTGDDSFVVQVADGKGGADTLEVDVTVQPVTAYNAWTEDHFGTLTAADQSSVWGEAADLDGDGLTNLQEFASGLDPRAADAAPNLISCALESSTTPPDHLLLSYRVRMDGTVPALQYSIQVCSDFTLGSWASLAESAYTLVSEVVESPEFHFLTVRLEDPITAPQSYFRLAFSSKS